MCDQCKAGREPVPRPTGRVRSRTILQGRDLQAVLVQAIEAQSGDRAPAVVRWLDTALPAAQHVVTYDELRNAAIRGEVTPAMLSGWQEAYAHYVNTTLQPLWQAAAARGITAVVEGLQASHIGAPLPETIQRLLTPWLRSHAGELVKYLSVEQVKAMNVLLTHYLTVEPVEPTALAQLVRPLVGLTKDQAAAVVRYREALAQDVARGAITERRAALQVDSYARRLHRYRARRIAENETTTSLLQAQQATVREARDQGMIGGALSKTWYGVGDSRWCQTCQSLHGTNVPFDQPYPGGFEHAHAHVLCRCSESYAVQPQD